MQDFFNFHKILVEWVELNRGKELANAFGVYKENYIGPSKFEQHKLMAGTIYATTRLLLPEERGIENPRPILLSLGPKIVDGDRQEVVIDICLIPFKRRPYFFTAIYKYYGKKLNTISEEIARDGKQSTKMKLGSKEAAIVLNHIIPSSNIVSIPRQALIKIHPIDLADWPLLCFLDTKGLGSRLPEIFMEFKDALEKRK